MTLNRNNLFLILERIWWFFAYLHMKALLAIKPSIDELVNIFITSEP